ncbi:hypothetical protein DPMN_050900 [Dreissena polymorpha]|uniref:Uncharacterized protein n=1 Tax=Dreissena polymorpha TaxID=45954 RepID=A0A9D4CI33_DREPO|nr:hypothetical protein DPMN_050900 [Dreissena polymorpha]
MIPGAGRLYKSGRSLLDYANGITGQTLKDYANRNPGAGRLYKSGRSLLDYASGITGQLLLDYANRISDYSLENTIFV